MAEKLKVYILAHNEHTIGDIALKLNRTRPVEVQVFGELRDFLTTSMQEKPDVIAVSMDFKHPRTATFPKFFKMALGASTIVFCESAYAKSIADVNQANADHKITNRLTVHNLWMKLLLFVKSDSQPTEDPKTSSQRLNAPVHHSDHLGHSQNVVKEQKGYTIVKDQSLEGIMQQLEKMDKKTGVMASTSGVHQEKNSPIHVRSTSATRFQRRKIALSNLKTPRPFRGLSPEDLTAQGLGGLDYDPEAAHTSVQNEYHKERGIYHIRTGYNQLDEDFEQDKDMEKLLMSMGGTYNPGDYRGNGRSDSVRQGGPNDNGNFQPAHDFHQGSQRAKLELTPTNLRPTKKPIRAKAKEPWMPASDQPNADDPWVPQNFNKNNKRQPWEPEQVGPNMLDIALGTETKTDELPEPQLSYPAAEPDLDAQTGKEPWHAEEPITPPEDSQWENIEKPAIDVENARKKMARKKALLAQNQKTIDLLEESCKIALRDTFNGQMWLESASYLTKELIAFAINNSTFKGYLLFANSSPETVTEELLQTLKMIISDNMIKNGVKLTIESPVSFSVLSDNFVSLSGELCNFTTTFNVVASGKKYTLSFLERERVTPPYRPSESDPTKIIVDLQHIPPGTDVNFDGYIHLPKNDRYLCIVKKNRSLSLEQIKRFMAFEDYRNVYIPKQDLKNFIQFYVQNTVNWDLLTYLKSKKMIA